MPTPTPVGIEPARIGPYLVERKLGAGGMGTVYLAHHEQTGQIVAVKLLSPSLAREEGLVARFMREIDALQKLKNPHVVELFDHGIDGDMHYYAMEFVPGETLTALLRRVKRLPWREVIDLSIQICVALKAAHDAGIIHRDLKPSNLLLTEDGTIKLTDFGVAQVFAGSKLTVTGGIIGTAEYMSPEQGQGKRITKRSDLYSLGAVMYVMLTGRPPFSGKTTLDVIHKHKYGQFDRPRTIATDMPYWLDDIVCQLMEKDPDKRMADAYVVNRRLQEVLRKVEVATSEMTMDGTTPADFSTMDGGAALARGRSARTGSKASVGFGSGTLMRDLFRAQIEAEQQEGVFRRLFNQTWVLLGLLAVTGLIVAYAFLSGRTTNFAPADETAGEVSSWRREPKTELERVVTLARHQHDDGDLAGAERTLSAFAALVPADSSEHQRIEKLLEDLRKRIDQHPRDLSFVDDSLDRADALAAAGKKPEAEAIWNGVIALYADDPRAAASVEKSAKKPRSFRSSNRRNETQSAGDKVFNRTQRTIRAGCKARDHSGTSMKTPLDLKPYIRAISDFPKPGILFRDITPLLAAPEAFQHCIDLLAEHYRGSQIHSVLAAEARGFIFAAPLALALRARFIPIRKPGKLPFEKFSHQYDLEYGSDSLEMHSDAVTPGERVLLVDDLLATGGTMQACIRMVERAGGTVVGTAFVIELDELQGRDRLTPYEVFSLMHYGASD